MHAKLSKYWILNAFFSNVLWHTHYIWKHEKLWWNIKSRSAWRVPAGRMWLPQMWLWHFLNFSFCCSSAGPQMWHFPLGWEPHLLYSYPDQSNHAVKLLLVFLKRSMRLPTPEAYYYNTWSMGKHYRRVFYCPLMQTNHIFFVCLIIIKTWVLNIL